jgi:hypothetical protein
LSIEEVLSAPSGIELSGEEIGRSRQDRPIIGHRLGDGPLGASLIGGCHADEPVGPAMLRRLVRYLDSLPPDDPLLEQISWTVVPDVNPDGAHRNASWSATFVETPDHLGEADVGFDLVTYARNVVRELPGDDIEFGFPRGDDDLDARPENNAVAAFLRGGAPFHLHGSFHGMAYAPGPWFLIERAWIERTPTLRANLRSAVRRMGYQLLDWDRRGDKGFERVDEGFSTRPDSVAMAAHFQELGDSATAALFRPSSMEYARSLGGDPFTFVSEMPLFLNPQVSDLAGRLGGFRAWLAELATLDPAEARRKARSERIRPMAIRDQMRLQLAFLQEAIDAAADRLQLDRR